MPDDRIIGIDLGTTNSLVAVVEDGQPLVLPVDGDRLLPSVVGLSPAGELLVGQAARNQYALYPEHTVRSIKRQMGADVRVRMGERDYGPPEISAFILQRLKRAAEEHLGGPVHKAVITVPAYFNDTQRQATKDAGEIAGLEVVRIINEPTAAALAYGLNRSEDQFVLVYDLGGGTFDVSIIEMSAGVLEVRASHGDTRLGGDDFDERIVEMIAEEFQAEHEIDLRDERRALARLTRAAEAAKIILSDHPYARLQEEFIARRDDVPLHLDDELARTELEELIEDLVGSTVHSLEVALKDAGLTPDRIDRVLLVGGSTRIPLVQRVVAERMDREPRVEINPDEAVALGAAVQGAIIAGEEIGAILVDVTAHSLGIEIADIRHGRMIEDLYSVIIRRNSPLPTSRSERYFTVHPRQTEVRIKVYQGEQPVASENALLGEFLLEEIPTDPDGDLAEILVHFNVDIDGILNVTASHRGSDRSHSIAVSADRERMDEAAKEAAREELARWQSPESVRWHGVLRQAQQAGADDLPEEVRARLVRLAADLEAALQQRQELRCQQLADEILDLLYELEWEEE